MYMFRNDTYDYEVVYEKIKEMFQHWLSDKYLKPELKYIKPNLVEKRNQRRLQQHIHLLYMQWQGCL